VSRIVPSPRPLECTHGQCNFHNAYIVTYIVAGIV